MPAQAILDCTRAILRPRHLTGVTLRSDERSQVEDAPPRERQNTGTTPYSKINTTAPFALGLPRDTIELCTDCDVCLSRGFDVLCVRMWRAPRLNLIFAQCAFHSFVQLLCAMLLCRMCSARYAIRATFVECIHVRL